MKNIYKQKGVTLLETILVLSLIAIIMIGGLHLYQGAKSSSGANEARRDLSSIVSAVESLFHGSGNYTGLTTQSLIKSRALPQNIVKTWPVDGKEYIYMNSLGKNAYLIDISSFSSEVIYSVADISDKNACVKLLMGGSFSGIKEAYHTTGGPGSTEWHSLDDMSISKALDVCNTNTISLIV